MTQGKLRFKPLRTPKTDRDNKPEPEPLVSEPDEPQVEIIPEPLPVLPLQASQKADKPPSPTLKERDPEQYAKDLAFLLA